MFFRGRAFAAMLVAISSALVLVFTKTWWSMAVAVTGTLYATCAGVVTNTKSKSAIMGIILALAIVADIDKQEDLLWLVVVGAAFA